jgi:hypothetical protein
MAMRMGDPQPNSLINVSIVKGTEARSHRKINESKGFSCSVLLEL